MTPLMLHNFVKFRSSCSSTLLSLSSYRGLSTSLYTYVILSLITHALCMPLLSSCVLVISNKSFVRIGLKLSYLRNHTWNGSSRMITHSWLIMGVYSDSTSSVALKRRF
jgi:hypothetical protein